MMNVGLIVQFMEMDIYVQQYLLIQQSKNKANEKNAIILFLKRK